MQTIDVRESLAEHLDYAAEWRDYVATRFPEDERNEWSANALRGLAAHVRDLDHESRRVAELIELHRGFDVWVGGEEAGHVIRRVGFVHATHDQSLDAIIDAARKDVIHGIWDGTFADVAAA